MPTVLYRIKGNQGNEGIAVEFRVQIISWPAAAGFFFLACTWAFCTLRRFINPDFLLQRQSGCNQLRLSIGPANHGTSTGPTGSVAVRAPAGYRVEPANAAVRPDLLRTD